MGLKRPTHGMAGGFQCTLFLRIGWPLTARVTLANALREKHFLPLLRVGVDETPTGHVFIVYHPILLVG